MTDIERAIAERSCGECHACCAGTGLIVDEVEKTAYSSCKHLDAGKCGIYESRPDPCRQYYCLWRMGFGRLMERPDRVGYFLDISNGDLGQLLVAMESRSGAFDGRTTMENLDKLKRDRLVILVRESKHELIGPEHLLTEVRNRGFKIVEDKG